MVTADVDMARLRFPKRGNMNLCVLGSTSMNCVSVCVGGGGGCGGGRSVSVCVWGDGGWGQLGMRRILHEIERTHLARVEGGCFVSLLDGCG